MTTIQGGRAMMAKVAAILMALGSIAGAASAGAIRYEVTNLGTVSTNPFPDADGYRQFGDGRAPHIDTTGTIYFGPVFHYLSKDEFSGPRVPGRPDPLVNEVVAGRYSAGHGKFSPGYNLNFISDGRVTRELIGEQSGNLLAINEVGQLLTQGDSSSHLYDFRDGSTKILPGLAGASGYRSLALAINSLGAVVGRSAFEPSGSWDQAHAWWTDRPGEELPTDLNALIDPKSGWTLISASGIGEDGRIVGVGREGDGALSYYLLTPHPVPEPSLLAFAAIAATVFYRKARRSAA